jgi:hypothetical protein
VVASPAVGDQVSFMSGRRAGTVDQVAPGRFRVSLGDVAVWLVDDAIFTNGFNRITLVCEPAGLALYAPGSPRLRPATNFEARLSPRRAAIRRAGALLFGPAAEAAPCPNPAPETTTIEGATSPAAGDPP